MSGGPARRPERGIAGGHGVVGMDEVEPGVCAVRRATERASQRGRGPRSPGGVAARARGGDVPDVGDRHAVEPGVVRLGQQPPELACRKGTGRWHDAMKHEHAHVRTGVANGACLPVRPHSQNRVVRTGIELSDDRDAHCGTRV